MAAVNSSPTTARCKFSFEHTDHIVATIIDSGNHPKTAFVGATALRRALSLLIVAAALATACGSSPTSPSAAGPPAGAAPASVSIAVNPNPVPFSGAPITDTAECADYVNTWFYQLVLQETGGNTVTFTSRIDTFDGKTANNITGLNIVISPHGSLTLHTRWCSGAGIAHSAQSIFVGTDSKGATVSASSPFADLMAPGK